MPNPTFGRSRRIPGVLAVPAALAGLFVAAPLVGLLWQVPWAELGPLLATDQAQAALALSLRTCTLATLICLVLGIPCALVIARWRRGAGVVRALVILPMTMPPVVAGLALLATFGRFGLVGRWLSPLGIEVGFTTTAVVIAQVFIALPFLVVSVEGGLRSGGDGQELAATGLGASPLRVLVTITLPRLAPVILAGALLSFARALGEFGATLTFAGSLQGVTRTLPLAIYLIREEDTNLALALAFVLVMIAFLLVLIAGLISFRPLSAGRRPRAEAGAHPDPTPTPTPTPGAHPTAPTPRRPGSGPGPEVVLEAHIPGRFTGHVLLPGGAVTALIGPNGAGKTTLLHALMGTLPAGGGNRVELSIGGVPYAGKDGQVPAHRRPVTLLTQDPQLFAHLNVLDNVAYGLRCQGLGRAQARATAQRFLAAVGCAELATRRPGELSGGQGARVALARAMATRPQVLALDEPFAALDIQSAAHLRELVAQYCRSEAVTGIIVTHNPVDVAVLASHVIALSDGLVTQAGTSVEVFAAPAGEFLEAMADLNLIADQIRRLSNLWQPPAAPAPGRGHPQSH